MTLRSVTATCYVTPLREGGSLPGLVEADDFGMYVLKFTGAGQGVKALVAEVVAGELARRLAQRKPDIVTLEVDPAIGRREPDQEVQDLLLRSPGMNLGIDFLPRALGFDPTTFTMDAAEASAVLWFDALIENVDRSWRNPNLVVWHGDVWLIDHGATLYFHHSWARAADKVARPYDASDHVLRAFATDLAGADARLAPLVSAVLLDEVLAEVPDGWLADPFFASPDAERTGYREHLLARLAARSRWLPVVAP